MTNTKRLSSMLEKRGIEYDDESYLGSVFWCNASYEQFGDGHTRLIVEDATPEQAIAATVGTGYGVQFAATLERPPETMVGETVYDSEGNAIGWITNSATVGVGTCHYNPDDAGFTWWDENDVEHYEEDSASDECDSASCNKCGFSMMVGEEGWFDGWDEITEWTEEDGSEHKGYVLKPRFKFCPKCGRQVE